jgi:sulfotransferase family protein
VPRPAETGGTAPGRRLSLKVLYIAGSGRSGSTILDNILGQVGGFASVGEVRFLWERGLLEDRICGCGEPFSTCPFWRGVLADSFGVAHGVDPRRMLELLARGTRARRIPAMLGGGARRRRFMAGLDELPERLGSLYRAIGERAGARVVVDSSKLPTYGFLLDNVPGIDLRVVHLIRDPRATAYSWSRTKALPDKPGGGFMQQQGPLKAAALWTLWNAAAQVFWRRRGDTAYLFLRYEEFVRRPRWAVERICELVDERPDALPFVSDTQVRLEPSHSVAGNPSRFTTGVVELRPDEEWRTRMRTSDRLVVTSLTWPLLLKYGYGGG